MEKTCLSNFHIQDEGSEMYFEPISNCSFVTGTTLSQSVLQSLLQTYEMKVPTIGSKFLTKGRPKYLNFAQLRGFMFLVDKLLGGTSESRVQRFQTSTSSIRKSDILNLHKYNYAQSSHSIYTKKPTLHKRK